MTQTGKGNTMATIGQMLTDTFGRVRESVRGTLQGIGEPLLTWRADPDANTIAWLVWHLTRVEDDHLAELAEVPPVWTSQRWSTRFALPFDDEASGYGFTSAQVAEVRADADLLCGYHDATHEMAVGWLDRLDESTLDRIVDERWEPPVTAAVRIVSVVEDLMQHAGQAAFVRGLAERAR